MVVYEHPCALKKYIYIDNGTVGSKKIKAILELLQVHSINVGFIS